jgi:hypothetical protein
MTSYDDLVATGTRERPGDLATLLGRREADSYTIWELQRPGVVPPADLPAPGAAPVRLRATTTDAPLFQPATLLMGDSFLAASRSLVYPLFSDVTVLHTQAGAKAPSLLAEEVLAAQVVVVEVVERDLSGGEVALLDADVRRALASALR